MEAVQLYSGQGKSKNNGIDWVKVVKHMGGTRSMHQCTIRYTQTMKPALEGAKSGNWSAEEVSIIKAFIGHMSAGRIAKRSRGALFWARCEG